MLKSAIASHNVTIVKHTNSAVEVPRKCDNT